MIQQSALNNFKFNICYKCWKDNTNIRFYGEVSNWKESLGKSIQGCHSQGTLICHSGTRFCYIVWYIFLTAGLGPKLISLLRTTIRDKFYYYYEVNSKATTRDSWAREPFAHHKEDQGTILRSLSDARWAGAWSTWGCWWTRRRSNRQSSEWVWSLPWG